MGIEALCAQKQRLGLRRPSCVIHRDGQSEERVGEQPLPGLAALLVDSDRHLECLLGGEEAAEPEVHLAKVPQELSDMVAVATFSLSRQVQSTDVEPLRRADLAGFVQHPSLHAECVGISGILGAKTRTEKLLQPLRLVQRLLMPAGSIELQDVLVDCLDVRACRTTKKWCCEDET